MGNSVSSSASTSQDPSLYGMLNTPSIKCLDTDDHADNPTINELCKQLTQRDSGITLKIIGLLKNKTHPAPHLPNCGIVNCSSQYDSPLIFKLTWKQQTKFADMVARAICAYGDDEVAKRAGFMNDTIPRSECCAVGNLAYAAMYYPGDEIRHHLQKQLQTTTSAIIDDSTRSQ
jgi:hypothetical protein